MINHIRTLLMNTAPGNNTAPGAEFIDPSYTPVQLPDDLRHIYHKIIPVDISGYGLNFSMLAIMRLLHQPDILPYTLRFDSRITYDLHDNYFTGLNHIRLSASSTSGSDFIPVLADKAPCELRLPVKVYDWDIAYDANEPGYINLLHGGRVTRRTLRITNGVTDVISLIPQYLGVRIRCDGSESFSGSVRFQAPLCFSVPDILSDLSAIGNTAVRSSDVFRPWGTYAADLEHLRRIWNTWGEGHVRLAAFITALAYQMERIRTGGVGMPHISTLRKEL